MNAKMRTAPRAGEVVHDQRPPAGTAPKLPHEHDEAPEAGAPTQRVIWQAGRDIEAGLVDTDNYTRATDIANGAAPRRRRMR